MEKKQYIIPEAVLVTLYTENVLVTASSEDYESETGSW